MFGVPHQLAKVFRIVISGPQAVDARTFHMGEECVGGGRQATVFEPERPVAAAGIEILDPAPRFGADGLGQRFLRGGKLARRHVLSL